MAKRTREHVIADLSINFVEPQALLAGHSVERWLHDYGIDLVISTFSDAGETEPCVIYTQIKATDHGRTVQKGQFIPVRIERAHLRRWLAEPMPMILIVYDGQKDMAYWVDLHDVFGGVRRFRAAVGTETLTVRIPVAQELNQASIGLFRQMRQSVVDRFADGRSSL